MTDKPWKRAERRVCKLFNATRIPITGRAELDGTSPLYGLEVKYRESLPKWMKHAMSQAKAGSTGDQWPVVVLVEKGGYMLAVVDPQDLIDWHGR